MKDFYLRMFHRILAKGHPNILRHFLYESLMYIQGWEMSNTLIFIVTFYNYNYCIRDISYQYLIALNFTEITFLWIRTILGGETERIRNIEK